MEKNELQKIIYSKIDELPTLPAVLPKLMSLMEDERSGAAQVADTIASDPALTSKILKVANSAYYGFSQEISSLDKAVSTLLGSANNVVAMPPSSRTTLSVLNLASSMMSF